MLKTRRIYDKWSLDDLFGQDQWCPVCGKTQFEYVEGNGIYCLECDAEFSVRMTAGDPGCVVDCDLPENSRYDVLLAPIKPNANPRSFWQVLKPYEGDLDRERVWCHNLATTGDMRTLYLYRHQAPVGERLYYFEPRKVAEILISRQWFTQHHRRHKRDPELAPNRYDYTYTDNRLKLMEQALRQRGCQAGYYTREQVLQAFNDGYWLPRCLPKVGETPVRQRNAWRG